MDATSLVTLVVLHHARTGEAVSEICIRGNTKSPMVGVTSSCAHHVSDSSDATINSFKDKAAFIFPDLSIRQEGLYWLKFHLFEIVDAVAIHRAEVKSSIFKVFTAKEFPGMEQSTDVTEYLRNQGLKMRANMTVRIRKDRVSVIHDLQFAFNLDPTVSNKR